jgi:hypothetical protein
MDTANSCYTYNAVTEIYISAYINCAEKLTPVATLLKSVYMGYVSPIPVETYRFTPFCPSGCHTFVPTTSLKLLAQLS